MRIRVGLTQKFVLLGTLAVTLTFIVTNVVSYQWHRATILTEISEKPALIARTGVLSLDGGKVARFLREGRPHGEIAEALLAGLYGIRNRNDPRATVSLLVREPGGRRVVEVLSTEAGLLPRLVEAGDPRYETISAVIETQNAATSRPYETERGTFLSAYAPLGSGKEVLALLEVAYPINVSEALWETRGRMLLLSYFLGFLSTLGLAIYAARRFVVPLQDLSRAIQGMTQGDSTYPIRIRSSDEIGQLAETFDRMRTTIETQRRRLEEQRDALLRTKRELEALTESLDAQVEAKTQELKRALSKLKDTQTLLIHKEKMASVGELAGGIAHEINTPLGVIVTRIGYLLSVLQEEEPQSETIEDLEAVYRQAIRISKIIRSLLDYARQQPKPRRPVAVAPLVQGCLDLVTERIAPEIEVELSLPPDLPRVEVDRERIEFVFVNLLQNALDAMPRGGRLSIRGGEGNLQRSPEEVPVAAVVISISDTGGGIAPEHLPKIFDPFFTTKAPGRGTGLGLYISYQIIDEHRGELTVESTPGMGSTFTVTLPAMEAEGQGEGIEEDVYAWPDSGRG